MKKILLATTVLVGTAGFASAEVTLSGNARMGIVNDGTDTQFSSRVRADIAMSGETDGGLSFGGSFGVHNAGAAASGTSGSVYISGAFGKLSMGDVVGAAEAVVGDLPEIGYTDIANNDTAFIAGDGFNGTAPAVLYTYSAGDLTVALGASDGVGGVVGPFNFIASAAGFPAPNVQADVQEISVGVKYVIGDYAVSAGYEMADYTGTGEDIFNGVSGSATHLVVGAEGTFSGVTLKAIYGQGGDDIDGYVQYGLGASYTADALTVSAMMRNDDFGNVDFTSYGVGAAYDLGGGAKVVGGIADNDIEGSDATYDLGVTFSF